MNNCEEFRAFTGNACPDSFIIKANLVANTTYEYEFKDRFDHRYINTAETDADGILVIPVTDPLSPDMFHQFSGAFEVRLYEADTPLASPVQLCIYDYIALYFNEVTPVPDTNNFNIVVCE